MYRNIYKWISDIKLEDLFTSNNYATNLLSTNYIVSDINLNAIVFRSYPSSL